MVILAVSTYNKAVVLFVFYVNDLLLKTQTRALRRWRRLIQGIATEFAFKPNLLLSAWCLEI